ncbi:MAG: penicillin-binding protein 2 [Deltaproteobacteria bacterium]|nr:MAG: penicillin-binding protein 2 [Deltaproteobacteria bacterium]
MKKPPKNYIKLRIAFMGVCFFLLISVICAKAVYLQVFCGSWLSEKAAKQYEKSFVQKGKRGTIYDRGGNELAVSIEGTSIAAYLNQIEDKPSASKALAGILRKDRRKLLEKFQARQGFVWVKRQATPKEVSAIKTLGLKGIGFIPEYDRFYPNKSVAAQVIGFTGIDGNGLEGAEYYYDQVLSGTEEKFTVLKDALGRGFAKDQDVEDPVYNSIHGGKNIILTIDRNIQYITQTALKASVKEFSAKSGMAVVMDPRTGEVLALSHYPSFNPNVFKQYPRHLWRNRALTDPFEPGSTMKIFSAAAALSSGIISPSTIFYCENGAYKIGANTIHDTHPRGWLSLQQIVKYSSNIGIAKVVEMVGPETLYTTLKKFGFGSKTGLDSPGETAGILTSSNRWSKIDSSAIAFGQGVSTSAMQLVSAAAAIANGGLLMKPFIVQSITNENGRILKRTAPEIIGRATSPEVASTVKRIMQTVVTEGGTGTSAFLDGYTVCGKTGTAQKTDESGTYARDKYISSFLGFAPADNPRLVILVVIDEPVDAHYGGTVAAPAFQNIAHETLQHLNVPPETKKGVIKAAMITGVSG